MIHFTMKRLLWVVLFLHIISFDVFSQGNDSLFVSSESSNKSFYLDIKSHAFFNNVEFFNDIQRGYTLSGFNFEPRLSYVIKSKAKLSAGFHMLYYAGESELTRLAPVLTFQNQLTPSLMLNIGTINSNNGHNLPVQLFKAEREYTKQPENGVQFLLNTSKLIGDLWINWERSLFKTDTIQEEFTAGFSARVLALQGGNLNIEIPFYALAVHKGGQINISSDRVSTLANFGGGVKLSLPLNPESRIGFEGLFFVGRDMSPNPHHPFKAGKAFLPKVFFNSKNWFADAGFWSASDIILPRGEEIFGSVSMVDPIYNVSKRELVTGNIAYRKEIAKGFKLAIAGQLYYDVNNSLLDYSFSFVAGFNESFLLRRK
jgi:hypothetical protein